MFEIYGQFAFSILIKIICPLGKPEITPVIINFTYGWSQIVHISFHSIKCRITLAFFSAAPLPAGKLPSEIIGRHYMLPFNAGCSCGIFPGLKAAGTEIGPDHFAPLVENAATAVEGSIVRCKCSRTGIVIKFAKMLFGEIKILVVITVCRGKTQN